MMHPLSIASGSAAGLTSWLQLAFGDQGSPGTNFAAVISLGFFLLLMEAKKLGRHGQLGADESRRGREEARRKASGNRRGSRLRRNESETKSTGKWSLRRREENAAGGIRDKVSAAAE
uniref:Uncharacterized protein n=1 Tax=Macrostomum lignano TaxID=282301 RepID=A0A1I8FGR7_9PLAT